MENPKKPLLIIMDADDLEEARELIRKTNDIRDCYEVDFLFSDSGKNISYSLKERLIKIEYKNNKYIEKESDYMEKKLLARLYATTPKKKMRQLQALCYVSFMLNIVLLAFSAWAVLR
ncbi:hypothetical protein ACYSNU_17665 [Enterococcus sp. LJL120]